ncbi:hypothetical protein E2C01_097886 [Portunus trituberculatus]|uniref:Transmembrane protein n=1 Tax=Portunus trituberculatus TaxID=210409 RepID=A0A5B7KB90_PORTR|nr:hypothetical protein [Portunus trituberculatus]
MLVSNHKILYICSIKYVFVRRYVFRLRCWQAFKTRGARDLALSLAFARVSRVTRRRPATSSWERPRGPLEDHVVCVSCGLVKRQRYVLCFIASNRVVLGVLCNIFTGMTGFIREFCQWLYLVFVIVFQGLYFWLCPLVCFSMLCEFVMSRVG